MGMVNSSRRQAAHAGVICVWLAGCALLLSACGPGTRPDPAGNVDAAARTLMDSGQYEQAAQAYMKLAELYPNSALGHQLGAAEAWVTAGRVDAALGVLNSVKPNRRQATESARRQILLAEIALLQQHPDDALQLSAPATPALPAPLRVRRHDVRARAYDELGAVPDAALERVALLEAGPPDALRQSAQRALWSGLSSLDTTALQQMVGSGNAGVAGWAELAQLAGSLRNRREELEPAVAEWIAAHPGHPAIPGITDEILTASRLIGGRRDHVVLLLPMGGQFARAAAAVRDGFLLQMYLAGGPRPRVTLLDTGAENALERYAEAVQTGAQFVVGPLEKEAVARIASVPAQVPTLALNQVPPAPRARDPLLFSFSLAPEDEAADAARRAHADGHRNALIVTPDNEWGTRLAQAFSGAWESLGGNVLEHVRYNPDHTDYATLTREIFNLDSSQLRTAMLRQDLGIPVHGSARKRRDADLIFMPASPAAARQVMPHFRYFGADRVPVYSTAAVFSGTPNPRLDHDIDGVRFPDIPWAVAGGAGASAFQQVLDREYSGSLTNLRRLYAFGADAYLIMARFADIAGRTGAILAGESGRVFLTRDGTFRRHLSWAEFRGGVPAALGPAAGE